MSKARPKRHLRPASSGEVDGLRARLADAEETLRAIRDGEVDALVVAGKLGPQVFTLEGADHAYRVLIESMNEGALTLTADMVVLYANQCFARMIKSPLEQLIGSSFRRFLSAEDQATLGHALSAKKPAGTKIQALLTAGDGSHMSTQIAIRPLLNKGLRGATIGLVVTDMTEARRTEDLLRTLTHHVVQAQETERGNVALDLHDNITQLLCAVLMRSQTLAGLLTAHNGPAKREALKLREMLGQTAEAVECISRNLRPSVLEHLGLVAVLRAAGSTFEERTGVRVTLTCVELPGRLPMDTEMALFRILQAALENVAKHARARHVTITLAQPDNLVELTIADDGLGFSPKHKYPHTKSGKGALGLLGMRERAAYVGGVLKITSVPQGGTQIVVRIPLPHGSR